MREWADFTVQEAGGRTTIVLQGPLLVSSIGVIDRRLREFDERYPGRSGNWNNPIVG